MFDSPKLHRLILIAGLLVMLAAGVRLGSVELGRNADRMLHVDELYFAACAARGNATGAIPVAGCHDNKGPLIYWIYQLVHLRKPAYDLGAIKATGFGIAALLAALVFTLAYRIGGATSGLIASLLVGQVFVEQVSFMALKTETTGSVFILLALLLATRRDFALRTSMIFAAGVILGFAVMTKQTFAIAALAVVAWLFTQTVGHMKQRLRAWLVRSVVLGAGVLTPFLFSVAAFAMVGNLEDFLASFLLYPSVYGVTEQSPFSQEVIWTSLEILNSLSAHVLITLGACAASVLVISTGQHRTDGNSGSPVALLLLVCLSLGAVLILSPKFFGYHLIPLLICMAVLSGWFVSQCIDHLSLNSPRVAGGMLAALLCGAVLSAAQSIQRDGGRRGQADLVPSPSRIVGTEGRYGYALAMWPEFYAFNGIIPASSVQFPWALPGTPATWAFRPPQAESWFARTFERLQQRNLRQLLADFERTRPAFILVAAKYAGGDPSTGTTDLPEFNRYIRDRCTYSHSIEGQSEGPGVIFACQ